MLRKDRVAIENAAPPADLESAYLTEATETIEFYRALARLNDDGPGDAERAREAFERLHRRRPDSVAYIVDLLAAEAGVLLFGNQFASLGGTEAQRARRVLVEAETAIARCRSVGDDDRAVFECIRALLLLALGLPDRALQTLASVESSRRGDAVAAYTSVALFRLGRADEAHLVLDRAVRSFGDRELLVAARGQIRAGTPFGAPTIATATDDPVVRLKAAWGDISGMDP